METHKTHILTDRTSSGNSYKYDNSGKLIFESFISDLNNEDNKNDEEKNENNLPQKSKNIIINSYDKDIEIDNIDLINIKVIDKKSKNGIRKDNKNHEIKNNENNKKDNINEENVRNINNTKNKLLNINIINENNKNNNLKEEKNNENIIEKKNKKRK